MSQQKDFQKLERKAYLSYHQDGLVDVIIGMCILGFGIFMATDSPGIFGWIPILFYMPLKNRLTAPRMGYVRFKVERRLAVKWVIVILVVGIALLFGLGIFIFSKPGSVSPQVGDWLKQYFMLVLGALGAFVFLVSAAWTGLKRFFVYSGLTLGIPALGSWLGIQPAVYVSSLGALILGAGLWMLARFLRNYPVEEVVHDVQ